MGKTFGIKPASGWIAVILLLFILINPIYIFSLNNERDTFFVVSIIFISVAGLAIIAGIIGIIIMHMKPGTLHIHDSSLELYGRKIERESVEAILIRGYFRPIVGLKPQGKKTLPPNVCFRLRDNREGDEVIAALEQWAEQQGIPVKYKFFTSWF